MNDFLWMFLSGISGWAIGYFAGYTNGKLRGKHDGNR